jgi:hypothetical protein
MVLVERPTTKVVDQFGMAPVLHCTQTAKNPLLSRGFVVGEGDLNSGEPGIGAYLCVPFRTP